MKKWMVLLMIFISVSGEASHLTGLRIFQKNDGDVCRVMLELDERTPYHYFELTHPERFVVDLAQTTAKISLSNTKPLPANIERIRTAKKEDGSYRIVFDLKQGAQVTWLPSISERSPALHIAFEFSENKIRAKIGTALPPKKLAFMPKVATALRPVVVMIDPGHGGRDPGAVGPEGILEKNIVLAISKELSKELTKQPGVNAYLTRGTDEYLTLRQRLRIARRRNADIFVAIHADAYRHSTSRGASVYALSLRGASSEAARWLASKENDSELGGVSLSDKDNLLRSVLINLSQTATIAASVQLGHDVLKQLNAMTSLHHDMVEQAPFMVLKSPDIPSILIETGFLSNPKEEQKLSSHEYQRQLAREIMEGIDIYFYKRPPPDTFIAKWVAESQKRNRA